MTSSILCNALTNRIESYLVQAELLRTSSSPDVIHDFRVASRSLLAIEPLLRSASKTGNWRKGVKQRLKSLTHLRDLQVFRQRFDNEPELKVLLDSEIENELVMLTDTSKSIERKSIKKQLRKNLQKFCSDYENKSSADSLLIELWAKHYNALNQRLDNIDYEQPGSIHKLRIGFKPFRYTAAFVHESGLLVVSNFDDFRYWQDIMGDINDLDVVRTWLSDRGGYENLISPLNEEADLLTLRLMAEEPAFRAFTEAVNHTIVTRLGLKT